MNFSPMVSKLILGPGSPLSLAIFPSTTHLCPFPRPYFSRCSFVSLFSTTNTNALPYGPSLLKGKLPPSEQQNQKQHLLYQCKGKEEGIEEEGHGVLDNEQFTRVFDIAALRVPAKYCFSLESRIRGHLLNWPRVRNIARVPGDEVEEELAPLLGEPLSGGEDEDVGKLTSLQRRMYGEAEGDGEELSSVLYRDRLAKEFNVKGFFKFRNLARISRPKKRNLKQNESNADGPRRCGANEIAMVEVVEESHGDEWKGLLGDGFKARKKWTGSTRLLLLDERYADKTLEELPQAVKSALEEAIMENTASAFEVVRCKLTLFYDYWLMNEILEASLPKDMITPSAFESIGHIAHLNLKDEHLPYKKLIAKVVLDKNKPKIQTVVNKVDAINNDYRTMQLEVLAGNHSLVTMVVENGLKFHVDLATVYWNSRLATERQRLLQGFTYKDVVCDVFSGVGPIAISAARVVKRVYANDLNPQAVDYLDRNSVLNKLGKKIKVFNMDGRRFINAMFTSEKAESITQVVMNLPKDAVEFLDAFRGVFRNKTLNEAYNFPMIHVYGFSKAKDPEFDFHERIRMAIGEVGVSVEMRRVRLVAPGKWMLCASFVLPASVAFAGANTKQRQPLSR
ncbi:tRNA (guanine(37)-N1)-methyltransferase 1 [Linum grandiflorum]